MKRRTFFALPLLALVPVPALSWQLVREEIAVFDWGHQTGVMWEVSYRGKTRRHAARFYTNDKSGPGYAREALTHYFDHKVATGKF
jgi:hypothetical protein